MSDNFLGDVAWTAAVFYLGLGCWIALAGRPPRVPEGDRAVCNQDLLNSLEGKETTGTHVGYYEEHVWTPTMSRTFFLATQRRWSSGAYAERCESTRERRDLSRLTDDSA